MAAPRIDHERHHAHHRQQRGQHLHGSSEEDLEPVVVQPLHQPLRVPPLDGQAPRERPRLVPRHRHRVDGSLHRGVRVEEPTVQEVPPVQHPDQIGHLGQVQVTRFLEPLKDDLFHGPGPVHHLDQLELPRRELVVDQVARVGEDRVGVAPLEVVDLDLDVGGELGPELARVDQLRQPAPHVDAGSPAILGSDLPLQPPPEPRAEWTRGHRVRSSPSLRWTVA